MCVIGGVYGVGGEDLSGIGYELDLFVDVWYCVVVGGGDKCVVFW